MENIGKSARNLNEDVQVAEPPPKKSWWCKHYLGPIIGALIRVGWEIAKHLILKK